MNFSLPEVKQSPDCGKTFSNLDIVSINSSIGSQRVAELVKLDASSNNIQVNASDKDLDGERIFMQIAVKDSTLASSDNLSTIITFID